MKPETIKAIFTNLLFVIGVILTIFGFVNGALTITRLAVFDTYPLAQWEESRCEIEAVPSSVVVDKSGGETMAITQEDAKSRKEMCLKSLENQRNIKKVEDIVSSAAFFVVGIFLATSFRRFILK